MNIIKANEKDIDQLISVTGNCAKDLMAKNIYQWNESYPSREVLLHDIALQQLWKLEVNSKIVGIVVMTEIEDEEYNGVEWLTENAKNLYIHRLAVDPDHQGKGYAQMLMSFAENYAIENKYASIRLDTFSQNKRNQKFYENRNYTRLGNVYFPNQSEDPFYCYEMPITKTGISNENY